MKYGGACTRPDFMEQRESQERPGDLLPGLPIIVFQFPTALIILIHMLTMSMIIADSIS
jgi:hypothetical protein